MSTCKTCGKEFEYVRSKGGTKTECGSCCNNKQRFAVKQKIIEFLGGKCIDCGYNKCSAALHAHHLDPKTKKFSPSGSHSRSWASMVEELEKCVLLCANCHAERHYLNRVGPDGMTESIL